MLAQAVGDHKVVDAPAHVPLPRPHPVAPPGVGVGALGVEKAEAVGKARGQQLGKLPALLIGEARVAHVLLGVFQVDLLVGHVHVPADDHGFALVQFAEIGPEVVLPAHAVVDALEPVLGVGGIDADQVKVRVFQRDGPTLVVVLLHAEVIAHGERRVFGENRGARIALLFGVAPVALPAGKVQVDLPLLQLGLLQAEEVRVQRKKDVLKALFLHGAQSVDVPGKKSHAISSPFRWASRLSS